MIFLSSNPTDLPDESMLDLFRAELEQQTGLLSANLLSIEKEGSSTELLQSLMRAAHSIKGAARIANRRTIVRVAHAMEDCFVLAQHGAVSLTAADIDLLLKAVDFLSADIAGDPETVREDERAMQMTTHLLNLENITARAGTQNGTPQSLAGTPAPGQNVAANEPCPRSLQGKPAGRVLRVTAEALDHLLGLAGEQLIHTRWLGPFSDSLTATHEQHLEALAVLERLQKLLKTDGSEFNTNKEEALKRLCELLEACARSVDANLQELAEHNARYTLISHRLYTQLLEVRMRPFSDVCAGLPRMVRDLGRSLGKSVRLEIHGGSLQVDRDILEHLESAICHLLRNAVDHGCELPELRKFSGKPEECLVSMHAEQHQGILCLTISDDGRGIPPETLQAAVRRWHALKGQPPGGDQDPLNYLFLSGFTLRDEVTEISGRGVGLDAVYNTVKKLRGEIRVQNEPGKGMKFVVEIPLGVELFPA